MMMILAGRSWHWEKIGIWSMLVSGIFRLPTFHCPLTGSELMNAGAFIVTSYSVTINLPPLLKIVAISHNITYVYIVEFLMEEQ